MLVDTIPEAHGSIVDELALGVLTHTSAARRIA